LFGVLPSHLFGSVGWIGRAKKTSVELGATGFTILKPSMEYLQYLVHLQRGDPSRAREFGWVAQDKDAVQRRRHILKADGRAVRDGPKSVQIWARFVWPWMARGVLPRPPARITHAGRRRSGTSASSTRRSCRLRWSNGRRKRHGWHACAGQPALRTHGRPGNGPRGHRGRNPRRSGVSGRNSALPSGGVVVIDSAADDEFYWG
jgi:hypothetical protein